MIGNKLLEANIITTQCALKIKTKKLNVHIRSIKIGQFLKVFKTQKL